jgi:hypothetical protein
MPHVYGLCRAAAVTHAAPGAPCHRGGDQLHCPHFGAVGEHRVQGCKVTRASVENVARLADCGGVMEAIQKCYVEIREDLGNIVRPQSPAVRTHTLPASPRASRPRLKAGLRPFFQHLLAGPSTTASALAKRVRSTLPGRYA